ncbi:CbiG protein/precorrin-3B C17-methyltransferase [Streptomyces himastatinicus ATCC 53653]|uniref:CbiG protein/precorrin-3B C17-methyltransferase n=1 Tax=Streptomyces himastatinicus ATCC 53653 TaxID=457427 RepID=D9WC72_9ACTN|nr:cobalamin biosynthesis protein [Streptomyces himastatinicus]EFL27120.1 CbiG protein/precorrin-3B C17-methyltransferase [Streptomyces himastatinicus ATCC 53653]
MRHPQQPDLVVGVGAGRGVSVDEVTGLVAAALAGAGLAPGGVAELATVEAKAGEPGLLAAAERFGVPLRGFGAQLLAAVEVPNPSMAALTAVGTPGVAEAAALLAAGPGGELLVAKRVSEPGGGRPSRATCAIARRGPHPQDGHAQDSTSQNGHSANRRRPPVACPDGAQ